MKNALIDPTTVVQHISAWTSSTPPQPVWETYPNSARVAEVSSVTFEVSSPLFWTACDDNVVADEFYYDTANQSINPVVNAPEPEPVQPTVDGAQTL